MLGTNLYAVKIVRFGYGLDWGIYGVWTGLILGLIFVCTAATILVLRIDWEKESQAAQDRSQVEGALLKNQDTQEVELVDPNANAIQ